jgi:uncharacterized membrane protein YphA (DoxX/SURF4 family)
MAKKSTKTQGDNMTTLKLLIRCLMAALMIRVVFFVLLIAALPFHKEGWSSTLLHVKFRYAVDFIYAGGFIGYLACALLFPARLKVVKALLFDRFPAFFTLVRLSAGCTFLFSSIAAIFFFDQSLAFFIRCGYSEAFMIFIIGLEMMGGLMLLFKTTAGYAALLLACDMIGAVYTHYHNYFLKNIPHPFGNSIPALLTLTLLVSIAYLNISRACAATPPGAPTATEKSRYNKQ